MDTVFKKKTPRGPIPCTATENDVVIDFDSVHQAYKALRIPDKSLRRFRVELQKAPGYTLPLKVEDGRVITFTIRVPQEDA
jgi:hypothetical protein